MANKVSPRMGRLEPRVKTLELFLSKFSINRIIAETIQGDRRKYEVLATKGGIADPSTPDHPFKIKTRGKEGGGSEYYVVKGSIVDGTNGGPQIISGLETWQDASAGYVIIEGAVASDLDVSNFSVQIVADGISANEVDTTPQGSVRLLLGKITIADGNATAWQAWNNSARCTRAFLNGKMIRVFESAPTHQDDL